MALIDDPVLLHDWHVVARSSDVPVGAVKGVRLLGEDIVLWRSSTAMHAWRDLCIHRGAKLSPGRVEKDCIVCPYHGWKYNDEGTCTSIPAHPNQVAPPRAHATTYQVRERYGYIWASLGEPKHDVPFFAQAEDPAYRHFQGGPYRFRTYGPRIIENFLDVGHLAHVHSGWLGDTTRPEIEDFKVEINDDGVVAHDIPIWQPDPDGLGKPGVVYYTYRVLRPLVATFVKTHGEQRMCMMDIVTPVDDDESQAWAVMAMNYGFDVPEKQLREFQDAVTFQDIPVVESQRPELLPLDLQAELHLRSDRTAIAYRQWLRKIGLKHGTA